MASGCGCGAMPLTALQVRVLALIKDLRGPGSHVAGSIPLHLAEDSERISRDIDLFHDAQAELVRASTADVLALRQAGLTVTAGPAWSDTFRRALIGPDDQGDTVLIDWAVDAAWRFFPPQSDPVLGWRLHDLDLACNKVLALGGRSESRDLVDVLAWSRRWPLALLCWAACGKDPGFNPLMLLEQMRRSAHIDPAQLALLRARHADPVALKQAWLAMADQAEAAITALADGQPDLPIGVLFLAADANARWPAHDVPLARQGLTLHRPSVGGCVPIIG
jgi:hypothetical protein